MKKILFFFAVCLASVNVYALPLGNPADATLLCSGVLEDLFCYGIATTDLMPCDFLSFRSGYYGDFVYNRHVKLQGGGRFQIEDLELYTNAGYLAFNFCNRVEIFGTLGATNFFTNTDNERGGTGRFVAEVNTDFSWSTGIKGTIFKYCDSYMGIEFQYFQSRNNQTRVTDGGISLYSSDTFITYREWQVGSGITRQIACLFPYIGVKYSHVQIKLPEGSSSDLENAKHWGYAVGTSLVACSAISLTVEGRWGDEKAFHVEGQLRF